MWGFVELTTVLLIVLQQTFYISAEEGLPIGDDDIETRIVNGFKVESGLDFKHHLRYNYNGEYDCGATLVEVYAVQVAITANHCVWQGYPNPDSTKDVKKFDVIAGDRDIINQDHEQYSRVEKIVSYPDYDAAFVKHDIALMFLKTPFKETKWVGPMTLPGPDWREPEDVIVVGWGSKQFGGPLATILSWADIPVVANNICEKYNNISAMWHEIDTRYQFCAGKHKGGKQSGACTGDSGGGAIGYNNPTGQKYLAGIVSYGTNMVCDNPWYPVVFTRMTPYVDWIRIEVAKYKEAQKKK